MHFLIVNVFWKIAFFGMVHIPIFMCRIAKIKNYMKKERQIFLYEEKTLENFAFKFFSGIFSETAGKRDVSITIAYSVPRESLCFS